MEYLKPSDLFYCVYKMKLLIYFPYLQFVFFSSSSYMKETGISVWLQAIQELNKLPENKKMLSGKWKMQELETVFRLVWQLFPFYSHNRGKVRPGDNRVKKAAWKREQGKTYVGIKFQVRKVYYIFGQKSIGNVLLELAKILSKCCTRNVNSLHSTGSPGLKKRSLVSTE